MWVALQQAAILRGHSNPQLSLAVATGGNRAATGGANGTGGSTSSAANASADSPIQVLQFQRLVRDTHYAHRKLFFKPAELMNWLKPALNQEEFQRLGEFLAEYEAQ